MELQELDKDQDTHLCLNCKTTIPGLLNYVKHKQQECSSLKKTPVSLSMDGPTIVSKNVSENAEFSHFGKKKSEKTKTTIQLYPPSTSLTEVGNIFESSSDEEVWGMNVDYVDDAEEERRSYGDSCDVRTGKNRDILEFVTKNTTGKKATEQNEIVEDSTNLRNCLKIEEDTVSDLCQNSKGEPLTLQYTDMHCATHTGLIKRKQDKPMKRKRNKSKRHRFKISQKFVNSIHDDPESCKKSPKSGLFKQKPKQMQKKITTAKDPFKCEYCTQSFIDMAGYMKHKENEHLDEVENGRSYGGMKLRRLKKKINKMDELTSVVYESEAMRERDTPGSDQETSAYMGALGLQSSKTQEKTQTSPKSNKSEDNKLVEDISKSIDEQNPENEESEMEVGTTQVGGKISSLIHCSECEYSSESIYSVQNHIKEKHDDDQMDSLLQWRQNEDVSKCDVCNSLILSCRLQHHYKSKIHRKRVLKQSGAGPLEKCTTCSKAFYLPEDVTIHMKQHVGKNVIKCLICKMKFRNKDELSTHQATDDHIQLQKWEAKSHELQVTSRKECMNKVTKLVMVDGKCRYRCNICQSVLGSKGVQAHIYSHTGDRPFKCPMCEQTYKLREDLNLHIKCHLGIKEKKCPHCDFSTVRSGCLKRHIDAIHNKGQEKNFICEICGARFYSSSLLKTHTQSHTGVRPFTCPYKGCIYAGRHKVELRYHMDTHTGERLFLCDMCGYGGKTKHALTKHRRTHSGEKPFKCDFTGCDYASTVCSHLKRHKRKHMGSKPYKCPYCEHRTANIENMHKHISKTNKHQGKKLLQLSVL
ncbi:uncharacterized protein LOC102801975 [Saccoglossus kowalevskii]|uniref:Zinc finger protein 782-like n=1 Tax=Saccoglossus kowalevskii TaxID=10224 RepID=A0ABM0MA89_SACKO|nr:PREDICTED: zinc finger protein 782-like [Saccoglossus kowalevskii]